ncbi:MAG: hypothetical protein II335_07115 [Firmicutes bacterium]|nr:hypothetical protein [Bacillota bacterium]
MHKGQWRKWKFFMSILSILTAVLTGCGHSANPPEETMVFPFETEVSPTPLPEGVHLRHLHITHQGMRSGPYYMLKTTDHGTYMKISTMDPTDSRMAEKDTETSEYLSSADTVLDCEHASLVLLQEDTLVRQLEQFIADAGALEWDGFYKSVSMPDVADSGDRYILYLELTDGTTVTMDSYNVRPAGFSDLYRRTEELFYTNSDYSHYYIEDFDTSPCTSLYVSFRRMFGKGEWRLELKKSDNSWTVVLIDPDGCFAEEGTEIADYRKIDVPLPYSRFLNVFKEHDMLKWNGYEDTDASSRESFSIYLFFEDGKEFTMNGTLLPEGFESFRQAMIDEISRFYVELANP